MADMSIPQMFVIAMAVSSAIMAGSGFNAWAGVGYNPGLESELHNLQNRAHSDVKSSIVTDAITMIGLAISGISIVVNMFVWVYLFPVALMNIGFPAWFAVPLGAPVLYVNLMGTAEFLRGVTTSP